MKTLSPLLALALLLGGATSAYAQSAQSAEAVLPVRTLSPGDRIRVTWREHLPVFNFGPEWRREPMDLVRIDANQVVGRRGSRTLVVNTRVVERLEVQVGTKPASAPAMVIASAAGFAGGFLMGALAASADPSRGASHDRVNAGLTAGVLIGSPVGALIAYLASRARPIYEDVGMARVTPTVSAESGAVGVSLTVGVP